MKQHLLVSLVLGSAFFIGACDSADLNAPTPEEAPPEGGIEEPE